MQERVLGRHSRGCRYWSGDYVTFNLLYWGAASGWETPLNVLPVVYTVQSIDSEFNLWYDPFEKSSPAKSLAGAQCVQTATPHLRVRDADITEDQLFHERFDVRIYDCPHLRELHWMHRANIVENSLTNCTSLRKVVFAGSSITEPVGEFVEAEDATDPTTSCAFYPLLYTDGKNIKPMIPRSLTAFPTQDQYLAVADNIDDGMTLEVYNEHISEVHENAADSCPYATSIEIVEADHNTITTVGPRAFSAFTNLWYLDLSHNLITSISDTALTGCTKWGLIPPQQHDYLSIPSPHCRLFGNSQNSSRPRKSH